jgi:hypothetical protein
MGSSRKPAAGRFVPTTGGCCMNSPFILVAPNFLALDNKCMHVVGVDLARASDVTLFRVLENLEWVGMEVLV